MWDRAASDEFHNSIFGETATVFDVVSEYFELFKKHTSISRFFLRGLFIKVSQKQDYALQFNKFSVLPSVMTYV